MYCVWTSANICSMRVSCESTIVQKLVVNCTYPVSSIATFQSPISKSTLKRFQAEGSWSIWTNFSTLLHNVDDFKKSLISSAYVERGMGESVCLKSLERTNRVLPNSLSLFLIFFYVLFNASTECCPSWLIFEFLSMTMRTFLVHITNYHFWMSIIFNIGLILECSTQEWIRYKWCTCCC